MDEFAQLQAGERERWEDRTAKECAAAYKKTWDECNHLARFEAWADLYYRRFGRLCPGKSEAAAMYSDSNDAENTAQHKAWHESGLARLDAILEVARLTEVVARLERKIEDMEDDDDG